MTKRCSKCGIEKELDAFPRDRSTKTGRTSQCKVCTAESVRARKARDPELYERICESRREWARTHKDRTKDTSVRAKYGISGAEFDAMYAKFLLRQGGVCYICGSSGNGAALHMDHDHKTGWFRGLLCRACNTSLGLLHDDIRALARAIAYLVISDEEQQQFNQGAQATAATAQSTMQMGGGL